MAFKVFYAWQHDRPNNLCRGLIRRALDQAKAQLNDELEIEDALREVEIDQDTQGVAGSPPIAETILEKIRNCDAFVPDLTFIPTGEDTRVTPNPNVLIEYGYALHALSDQRIIGVFNDAFGTPDNLPFDLRHKRWPIRYHAVDEGESEDAQAHRRAAREELASRLADAIRDIIRTFAQSEEAAPVPVPEGAAQIAEEPPPAEAPAAHAAEPATRARALTPPPTIVEQYPWDGGIVGIQDAIARDAPGYQTSLFEGPTIFLRLKSGAAGKQLSNVQTMQIVRDALRPMASQRSTGWSYARNRHGVAAFTFRDKDPGTAFTASLFTRTGELHGIDCYHLQVGRFREDTGEPYVPTGAVEEILIDALANFLDVAKNHAKLATPLEVVAGLEGVEGYRLAVDRNYFAFEKFVGRIFSSTIGERARIDDYDCDPFDVLLPLFKKIYDEAGYERPDVRTAGKSQR